MNMLEQKPSRDILEKLLASIESGKQAFAFSSEWRRLIQFVIYLVKIIM